MSAVAPLSRRCEPEHQPLGTLRGRVGAFDVSEGAEV